MANKSRIRKLGDTED